MRVYYNGGCHVCCYCQYPLHWYGGKNSEIMLHGEAGHIVIQQYSAQNRNPPHCIIYYRVQCVTMHFPWWSSTHYNWTRMWANAQRDGRPVEHRWRPLFNAAKFGWRPLLESCAVTLPRRETRWNLQGCPKLVNRSQPLVGRSSSYYQYMWRRYCCLTSIFSIVDTCLSSEDIARQLVRWCQNRDFLRPVLPASRVQHISDLHSKFALGLHHVWKCGRHPICGRWD